jgi:antitoxin (DNA-binding transcriptional repressor) of toxin-antitoxin stability system
MKIMSVEEFKTNFSEALKWVLAGEEIGIVQGKKREVIAKMVPNKLGKKPRRKLGLLEGKGKVKFGKDFKITEKDFLGA